MIRNYIKTAWRNLWNNKVFSFINIIGLAIGLSASFVIGIMVYYDFTFDKFHPDSDRIYRITSNFSTPEGKFYNRGVPVPLGNSLKEGMGDIELVCTFYHTSINKINNKEANLIFKNPDNIIFTDNNYFQLFPYQLLAGNLDDVLSNPNEVVLTKTRAIKYFPNLSPTEVVGKSLVYNDSVPLKVTGIINNFKKRSDLKFQEFISFKSARSLQKNEQVLSTSWDFTNSASQVFVKFAANGNKASVQFQLDKLAKEHENQQMIDFGATREFYLQPLADLHFNSRYGIFNNIDGQASKSVLVSLALIALFLLILACINFININTANATKRAKEIGIRKTLGSSKKQLIFQFLGETFLLTLAAAMVSLLLSVWLFRIFSDFIPHDLSFELFMNPIVIIFVSILLVIVTLLSGFYPALVLSQFKPVSVLKNQISFVGHHSSIRKYLIVFQFVIAQIFIIATLLVGQQINYLLSKDMGFKTDATVFIRLWSEGDLNDRITFVSELKSIPHLSNISLGGNPPASSSTQSSMSTYFDDQKEIHTELQLLHGDTNYRELYEIKLLAGRDPLNDTIQEYVINETYMKILGFQNPKDALGKTLKIDNNQSSIVGVMGDFNQRSLKSGIKAMALIGDISRNQGYSQFNTIHFSLPVEDTENWAKVISQIENKWKTIYPNSEFKLNFMDESIKRFYEQERKTSLLLKWATGLAILISCLGLLGLVIYTTERRTKEIGIRKILGASLVQLNFLLCKEFMILVAIAFIIAAPIAYWGIDNWLQNFAFKANVSWWIFILSGMAMLFIALVIMSIRTLSTAKANPVNSLKTE